MGKYAATRAFKNDRSDPNGLAASFNYLLEVPKDESQFQTQSFLYGIDPTGIYSGYLTQRDLNNYWNDYFRNTGLTWSDVKYPTMLRGFGNQGSTARSAVNFVSKNITRLYR